MLTAGALVGACRPKPSRINSRNSKAWSTRRRFGSRASPDRSPAIELPVGAPVSGFELLRLELGGPKDDVSRVEAIPVSMQNSVLGIHPLVEGRVRVGRQDVEGGRLDALLDRPGDRAVEDIRPVMIHAENKATVDHYAQPMQPTNSGPVVTADVLELSLLREVGRVDGLKAHE